MFCVMYKALNVYDIVEVLIVADINTAAEGCGCEVITRGSCTVRNVRQKHFHEALYILMI